MIRVLCHHNSITVTPTYSGLQAYTIPIRVMRLVTVYSGDKSTLVVN